MKFVKIKDYLFNNLKGKKFHFKCECAFPLDFIGVVKDYKLYEPFDVILYVERNDGKLVNVTFNHPNLYIKEIAQ